jgi:hypothetical protein
MTGHTDTDPYGRVNRPPKIGEITKGIGGQIDVHAR